MSNDWQALSGALGAAVQAAGSSIVRVDAGSRWGATGIVWSADAIVTAAHVLREDAEIQVGLPDGTSVPATVAGRDDATDIAVLRAEAGALERGGAKVPTWGGLDAARVGHLVLAVARPGRTVRAAVGVIGALGESWRTALGGTVERYVEADIGRRPGFSGGALIDARGHALGMNTALGRHGPAVTLPAETLRRIVPDLLSRGSVPRGYLGVGAYPVRVAEGSASAGEAALIIVSIEPNGPAARAGVQQGDVLLSIDGERTSSLGILKGVLDGGRAGRSARLGLVRAGQLREVEIALGTA